MAVVWLISVAARLKRATALQIRYTVLTLGGDKYTGPFKGPKNRSSSPCSKGLVGLNSAVRLGFPVSGFAYQENFPVAFALVANIYLPTQA
jgi:hypothetical protein